MSTPNLPSLFPDPVFVLEFPREPSGPLKGHLADEANARLAFYLPIPPDQLPPPGIDIPPRPQLPEGVADAPLVRVFNFLRMQNLCYDEGFLLTIFQR
jgi:mediator of RNA polymerase II transcription subunit 14